MWLIRRIYCAFRSHDLVFDQGIDGYDPGLWCRRCYRWWTMEPEQIPHLGDEETWN